MRKLVLAAGIGALLAIGGYQVVAQVGGRMPEPLVPADQLIDYSGPDTWLCRPDKAGSACTVDLDAMVIDGKARRTPQPFVPAAAPPLDCFYVYPTVSMDRTMFSDMTPDDKERTVVIAQAARFASACRVFAPLYRQFTLPALIWQMQGGTIPDDPRNYQDVRKAWTWYLAHENKGRGVVLIGHSQGAILLNRLIREEIDGKPLQGRLAGALLAGNLDLTVPRGRDRGGTFKAIPLCRRIGQTGCVVAWSTYPDDSSGPRVFGNNAPVGKDVGACTNPAALGGGRGLIKSYMRKPPIAPAADPPFVEAVGQLSAECVTDEAGSTLRVRIEPGPMAPVIEKYLALERAGPAWGLHSRDINLVEGNLIDIVRAQGKAWARR